MLIKDAKAKVIKELKTFLDSLDPSGESSRIYTKRFKDMTDKEFVKYMDWWVSDEKNDRIKVSVLEFERNIDVDNIIKTAELINVPLYEYVACPDINGSSEDAVTCTPEPVPVGYIQPKRMPQTVFKKTTGSLSDTKRNPKTGQVTGDDRTAMTTDVETYSLLTLNSIDALKEFLGPRGDDNNANAQMQHQIANDGFCTLSNIETDRSKKTAINTLDTYFHIQGFMTNIVYPPDVIPSAELKYEGGRLKWKNS